jgi:predicted nuclease of predicted toxin-antitoxin system
VKLLFDQNLSPKLPAALASLYPDSVHVRTLGMREADDGVIWDYAKANGYVIASKDGDFQQRSLAHGHPPKVIRLEVGNCANAVIVDLLTRHAVDVEAFLSDPQAALLLVSQSAVFKLVHPSKTSP